MGWNSILSNKLEITISNGESCKAGSSKEADESHTFNPKKKITKVEVIVYNHEKSICQMNFYSGKETLVQLGRDDDYVKKWGGRVEIFEIAADEQLIGAKLYHGDYNNYGVD